MSDQKPSFYAVIPSTVRYDERLSSSEKLFYAEITAMSNKYGYCFASNAYFSKLFGVSKNTVTRWVGGLKDAGHIRVNNIRDGKQIVERRLYPILNNDDTHPKKCSEGTNINGDNPTHKNGEDNTININTTSNNIPDRDEVISYFNDNGYSRESAIEMYNYYNTSVEDNPDLQYWRDSRGNMVKNWKMKARSVWFKDENKKKTTSSGIQWG